MENTSTLPDQAAMDAAFKAEAAAITGMQVLQAERAETAFDYANSNVVLAWLAAQEIEYRFNTRQEQHEIKIGKTWQEWGEGHQAFTREQIEQTYFLRRGDKRTPLSFSDPKWRNSLNALSQKIAYDPFKKWLLDLPNFADMDVEFRVPRVRMLLCDMLGAEKTDLNQFASAYTFGQAVCRALSPGMKFDAQVVLIGPQGCGKSSFYELAFPEEYRDVWFTDSLRWDSDVKTQVEVVLGAVIVEAAENVGFRHADVERTKAMLSRSTDRVRLAYRRNAGIFKRRCAIVSTTNSSDAIPFDPTGSRRHIPVVCNPREGMTRDAMEKFWDLYREAIWAEVLDMVRQQYRFVLMGEMEQAAMALADRHMDSDEVLEHEVAFLSSDEYRKGAGLYELMGKMGMLPAHGGKPGVKDQHATGAALRRAGWIKKVAKRSGKSVKLWFPPE